MTNLEIVFGYEDSAGNLDFGSHDGGKLSEGISDIFVKSEMADTNIKLATEELENSNKIETQAYHYGFLETINTSNSGEEKLEKVYFYLRKPSN